MAEAQSTDKNEGSSSDVVQLQAEPEMAPKEIREVASSPVITQLHNRWMWRLGYGLCKVTPELRVERENTKDCWRKKSEANHAGLAQRIQATRENKMLLSEALILL